MKKKRGKKKERKIKERKNIKWKIKNKRGNKKIEEGKKKERKCAGGK